MVRRFGLDLPLLRPTLRQKTSNESQREALACERHARTTLCAWGRGAKVLEKGEKSSSKIVLTAAVLSLRCKRRLSTAPCDSGYVRACIHVTSFVIRSGEVVSCQERVSGQMRPECQSRKPRLLRSLCLWVRHTRSVSYLRTFPSRDDRIRFCKYL